MAENPDNGNLLKSIAGSAGNRVDPDDHVIPTKRTKLNTNSTATFPNGTKRLFPGPAGLLTVEHSEQTELCSQRTLSTFQEGPWQEMSKHFEISTSAYLFDQFNIAWIKRQATGNQLTIKKAPFLAGLILSLEVAEGQSQKSVNVTLKDLTGTIRGSIVHSLYEEHAPHFTVGSVLVLVQFGVLSCTCDQCDDHHLTITHKNLCAIYGQTNLLIRQVSPREILEDFQRRQRENVETPGPVIASPKPGAALQGRKRAHFVLPTVPKGLDATAKKNPTGQAKTLFTFKKIETGPLSETSDIRQSPRSLEAPNMELKKSGKDEKMPVTVTDVAHEQLWKDMLADVDLSALFEEEDF